MLRQITLTLSSLRPRSAAGLLGGGLALALVATGCTGGDSADGQSPQASPRGTAASALIPQPIIPSGLRVGPENTRVDLAVPMFSNPANITNPLHPTAVATSTLLLGTVDDQPFRTEVTLLPQTRIIEWQGQRVETLVSQYVAFLGGRLHEVAYDYYAQDDSGAVWYFGEDVFNFKDGAISDTHGTWIAGVDGPAAMIMPARLKDGDTYRPENIPGLVFEEVTVKATDQALAGPFGSIKGGLVIDELHMDGTHEDKTFAPGYGEFVTGGGGDVEALALSVPTDAGGTPVPAELAALTDGSLAAFAAVESGNWKAAAAAAAKLAPAWQAYQATGVPKAIEPLVTGSLATLSRSVGAQDTAQAGQAAIDVARSALDLQLRHRPVAEVDLARVDLWLAQLRLDAAAENVEAVNGDFFAIDYVRDRIQHRLGPADLTNINTQLEELYSLIGDEDLAAASDTAGKLRTTLAGLKPTS